jgi:hypothetical protein
MSGFIINVPGISIRFRYYTAEAPVTAAAFAKLLPFTRIFLHARISGQEIWTDLAPPLNIIQENSSVFTVAGEAVYGPSMPLRSKTRDAMGIYYGEGKGLDGSNIFAKVWDEDMTLLRSLGDKIWREGLHELTFDKL